MVCWTHFHTHRSSAPRGKRRRPRQEIFQEFSTSKFFPFFSSRPRNGGILGILHDVVCVAVTSRRLRVYDRRDKSPDRADEEFSVFWQQREKETVVKCDKAKDIFMEFFTAFRSRYNFLYRIIAALSRWDDGATWISSTTWINNTREREATTQQREYIDKTSKKARCVEWKLCHTIRTAISSSSWAWKKFEISKKVKRKKKQTTSTAHKTRPTTTPKTREM